MGYTPFLAAMLFAVGGIAFGRFEDHLPFWRRLLKLVLLVGITALLQVYASTTAALSWLLGMGALGLTVHFVWCRKNKIDWYTAEPRARYYSLRGVRAGRLMSPDFFCGTLITWAELSGTPLEGEAEHRKELRKTFREHWNFVYVAIMKSCLLDRLMYGGESVRTRMCPKHKGRWSGAWLDESQRCECEHGSCLTGWLPNPGDPVSKSSTSVRLVKGENGAGTPMIVKDFGAR